MDASNDGSESVDQFLARIASLNAKQGLEEAERSRRMEEEMLQARKERQARRAERARSLSPSKTGPMPSIRLVGESTPKPSHGIDPPVALTPPIQSRTLGRSGSASPNPDRAPITTLEFSRPLPPPSLDDQPSLPSPPLKTTTLSRSGTLSWQQRPLSRGVGSIRSRPQSVSSLADISTPSATGNHKVADDMSRRDIAASLGGKDPSWFRQTPDRGLGSAAYRKNDSDAERPPSFASRSMRLPGMAKDMTNSEERTTNEPEKPATPTSPSRQTRTPALGQQPLSNVEVSASAGMVSAASSSPSKSAILDVPTLMPSDPKVASEPEGLGLLGRTSSVLSTAGRPPSPTKGLGGFVQSAMMKRSDSVSKRWSVQANSGLKRGDSVANSRPPHLSGTPTFTPGHSRNSSKDTRGFRDGNSSPLSSSRPVSSHGSEPVPITRGRPLPRALDDRPESPRAPSAGAQENQLERPQSSGQQQKDRPSTPPPSESPLARSPSKTMDSRRWSPTKASWLESALNKPDSPRFTPAKPEVPAWKLNMQKSKQEHPPQMTEVATATPTKPAFVPRALDSTPLIVSTKAKESVFNRDPVISTPEKTPTQKPSAGPTIQQTQAFSGVKQTIVEKKDEKPAVPSKRNITPVALGSAFKDKKTDDSLVSDQTQRIGSVNKLATVTKGEPQPDTKPSMAPATPQSPSKTDFRTSLKSRQAASTASNDGEPEFKAVFGKLKRTQTQNYVAPDLLKDNIARGKAALNTTGGPQKTKRVDDFKESILQKKEAMKAGGGSTPKRPESTSSIDKPAEPIPEALARRMTLHKTGPSAEKIDFSAAIEAPEKKTPPVTAYQDRPGKPTPPKKNLSSTAVPAAEKSPSAKFAQREVVAAAVSPSKQVNLWPKAQSPTKPAKEKVGSPAEPISDGGFKSNAPDNSKIAARLNPALAGLLSRSGSPRLAGGSSTNGGGSLEVRESQQVSRIGVSNDTVELTHVTKGRAKGPKRRAPQSSSSSKEPSHTGSRNNAEPVAAVKPPTFQFKAAPVIADIPSTRSAWPRTSPGKLTMEPGDVKTTLSRPQAKPGWSQPSSPQIHKGPKELMPVLAASSDVVSPGQPDSTPKTRPVVAKKSPEVRKVSSSGSSSNMADKSGPVKPSTPKKFEVLTDRASIVSSPPKFDVDRRTAVPTPPASSTMPLTPSKSRLNTPKPLKPLFDASIKTTSATASGPLGGLGLQLGSAAEKTIAPAELTPPPETGVVTTRADPLSKTVSPSKSTTTIRPQLESFFGALPQARDKAEFDTQAFLSSQESRTEKTRTLGNQIWEVTGDGKKIAMPPQQEHILFEDCMYLSVHAMQLSDGSKSAEVYLWCGDEVPEAAVEDAQLFCRKVARDNNAKLEVMKQGKESSGFFQALGGIVIVRRNKSSALYMLCGRRHLGHVAFDEVDLSASSLSSGLPFLVSAKFGRLYLWKGAGSNQEDVGCARLIGMDLGLTGEIEEVVEGEEPASFWESFSSRSPRRATPPTRSSNGATRIHSPKLYRVEHDRPKSSGGFWGLRSASPPKQSNKAVIEEIAPFDQKDLDAHHIHILDIYDALYVLVGPSAKKPAEFVTAIQVAQEMAVLAPSIQDRSVLPACYVVMGEPPQPMQAAFRKWRPERSASQPKAMCVRVEEVMEELGIMM